MLCEDTGKALPSASSLAHPCVQLTGGAAGRLTLVRRTTIIPRDCVRSLTISVLDVGVSLGNGAWPYSG